MPQRALCLIPLLEAVNLDKGSVDTRAKYKSQSQRWFTAKKGGCLEDSPGKNTAVDEPEGVGRDTLMKLRWKGGAGGTSKNYIFLGVFQKYYNKWFVFLQKSIRWDKCEKKEELKKTQRHEAVSETLN